MPTRIEENGLNYPGGAVGFKASNGTTEVVVIPAPGDGKRLRLTGVQLSSTDDANQTVTFRNGISGSTFYSLIVPAASAAPTLGVRDVQFGQGGFVLGANQSLNAALGEASITAVSIAASADILDVTP
jgi:hypothetical protein